MGFSLPLAHVAPARGPQDWAELARAWEFEPLAIGVLVFTGWIYWRGSRRLRSNVSPGRGLGGWEIASFWAGWWTLVVALVSPLHPWGRVLFSAHMTQHELLMVVAAPLLVLGRPLVALMFALPAGDARSLARAVRAPCWQWWWRGLSHPFSAWVLHAVALWIWHVPRFFEATLESQFVHDLQHVSFFGTALLFWWALIHGRAGWRGAGAAILYLFTTMLHSGLLAALLTLANVPFYPRYAETAPAWSLSGLEDQQLGGVIMWVPAGLIYLCAALALLAGWLRQAERSMRPASGQMAGTAALP